jgi:hypothetical protein
MTGGPQFDKCREMLREGGVVLYFKGPVTQEVVEGLGSMIRRKVDFEIANRSRASMAFAVLVEQLQNVLHYAADAVDIASGRMASGELIIRLDPEGLCLSCGNLVARELVARIRERLDALAGADKETLKALYKAARQQGPDAQSRGAGLGFLEMARRSVRPMRYDIEPIADDLAWFSLDVVIA